MFAGFLVPLEPSAWVKTNFPFKFAPDYSFKNSKIVVESDDDLGGYAHKLRKPFIIRESTQLKIDWEIKKFPEVEPKLPFTKKQDDYPLRVGLIIAGGGKAKIPKAVLKRLPFKEEISNILYYGAFKSEEQKKSFCGDSPHNDYAVYCAIPSKLGKRTLVVRPLDDLQKVKIKKYQAKLLGIWLFADTDDSESASSLTLNSLEFTNLQ